jgi:hypothetical protein
MNKEERIQRRNRIKRKKEEKGKGKEEKIKSGRREKD